MFSVLEWDFCHLPAFRWQALQAAKNFVQINRPDPGPPRGRDDGSGTPAATSGDLREAAQRRTDGREREAFKRRGIEDWKGLK